MSDLALSVQQPTRQAIAVVDRSAPRKVTGRLRTALDAMVWQGACRSEAAVIGGMTDHSLRAALKKPHVKAHYLAELEVLRTSERARNIHAMVEVRDQNGNQMAKLNAALALERQSDEVSTRSIGSAALPGLTIQIINHVADAGAHAATARDQVQVIDSIEDGAA